ncbi:MAG: M23 family metallopeptidase [Bacteroidia bacterium]|nr:M23 family metallopeptidase [Bacteroidia bacterium]
MKQYRVELIDDVTLSQSKQFLLKPITVVWIAALLFILIVGGTAALFVYTPALHNLIPGYKNPEEFAEERQEMATQLAEMENQIERWTTYVASFRKLAGVEGDSIPDFSEDRLDSMRVASGEAMIKLQEESDSANSGIETKAEKILPEPVKEPVPAVREKIVYVSENQGVNYASKRYPLMQNLFSPITGEIRKSFDEKTSHYGVDIVAEENTLIRSVADGFVIIAEYSDDNGWVIGVASAENVVTFYKHNSRLLKDAGTYVYAGEPIAVIGNTGENSTGPHLHLELWRQGRPVDPTNYIEFN